MPEKPKLYLDQMFGKEVAAALRSAGFDVIRAAEVGQSRADDEQILERAIREKRVLITLDEHFGDWVVLPLARHPGVVRVKVRPATTQNTLSILLPFLNTHTASQMEDQLVILSRKRSKWIRTA